MSYTSKKIDDQNDLYEIKTTNNGKEITFNVGVTSENQLDEVVAHHLAQVNGDVVIPEKTYRASRMEEYPPLEEQLDNIYHNGIDAWKATIKTIKDKYPKG